MKNLEYYLSLNYPMVILEDTEEGGFVVSFPDLKGCLTCGETVELAVANAKDAKKEWLIASLEEKREIPEPSDNYFPAYSH